MMISSPGISLLSDGPPANTQNTSYVVEMMHSYTNFFKGGGWGSPLGIVLIMATDVGSAVSDLNKQLGLFTWCD